MKKNKFNLIALFIFIVLSGSCKKDEITICSSQCPASEPWKVESLDLGLPCFSTYELCTQWAASHGYNDKPCVKCNP